MKKIRHILEIIRKILYLITCRFRKSEIRIIKAVLSGDGSFVDIRYWLSRPELFTGNIPVSMVCEQTGQRFELMRLPKFGMVRTKHEKRLSTGILLFYNRDRKLCSGSCITLFFGSLCAKNVKVV